MDLFDVKLMQYLTFGKGLVKDPCAAKKHKLLSLLNLLCNDTQNTSTVSRDACYGCFFRAALVTSGGTLLTQLSLCATTYLNNTVYQTCATQLQAAANGVRATAPPTFPNCYSGYCEFVQCVRRVNSAQLVDQCFLISMAGLNLTTTQGRVNLFTNTTSCILAASRCDAYNPITGVFQGVYGSQSQLTEQMTLANALQITPNGDIRIVSFPRHTFSVDQFCMSSNQLDQASSGLCTLA